MHMYIFFCSVAVFNIPEQDQKAGSSTRSPPHEPHGFCFCLSSGHAQKSSGVFSLPCHSTPCDGCNLEPKALLRMNVRASNGVHFRP